MDMSGLNKIMMMMMLSILSKTARSNGFLDEIIACCRGDVTAANKTNPASLLLLMDSCQKHRRALWGNKSSVTAVGFWPRVHMAHRFRRISVLKKMMSPHRVKDRCYCAQFICPWTRICVDV
ncbi:hypothetical protein BU54_32465 [Escherichia coli O45:H2 str. 2010C-4211]|nr:hypothetical protein BU54_32465 [Escherichia coli O45:H2 str. 2010C-4211]